MGLEKWIAKDALTKLDNFEFDYQWTSIFDSKNFYYLYISLFFWLLAYDFNL